MNTPQQGQLFWFDLLTTDVDRSVAFYTALFGWAVTEVDSGDAAPYRALTHDGVPFGGMVPMSDAAEIGAHWKAYMRCDAVDATAEAAVSVGGEILVPPTDLPEVGRYAAIGDPFGGYFSPLELLEPGDGQPAPFSWHELRAPDFAVAWAFYSTLFPWDEAPVVEREDGAPVQLIRMGGVDDGVVSPKDSLGHWIHHVAVGDIDEAIKKAESLGANCLEGPTSLPSVRPDAPALGRTAVLTDPSGALFGLCAFEL